MKGKRIVIGLAGTAGALLAVVVVGGGWVYSGQLLPAPERDRTLDVRATLTSDGTVRVTNERRACAERFGLLLEGGAFLRLSGPFEGTCGDGTGLLERQIEEIVEGDPPIGEDLGARFDEYVWVGGPELVGLDPDDISFPTERGDAEAWFFEGEGDVWVIVVHGRSATRSESLRILPTLVESGFPTMVITYRNDFAGGPDAEDDVGRFGQGEWPDLRDAVAHAKSLGASKVVLMGMSQGGSLIGYYLRNEGADDVAGVILDSPLLDLGDTLSQQARNRNIPDPLIPPILLGTRMFASIRAGFGVGDVNHVDTFAELDVPTLLIVGVDDDFVPPGPAEEVAERRSEGLTFEAFEGAGHVEAWNFDADRYTTLIADFLARL